MKKSASQFYHLRYFLLRFLLFLLIFEVTRLLFLLFNFSIVKADPLEYFSLFFYGLLFDISAAVYFNGVFILLSIIPFEIRYNNYYQTFLKIIFLISSFAVLLLNLIDTGYFRFSNKRSGKELFAVNKDISNMTEQYILDYWYLAIILIAGIFVIYKIYPEYKNAVIQDEENKGLENEVKKDNILIQTGLFIVIICLAVLGARGGLYLKPIRSFDANRFVRSDLLPYVINTPFQIISSINASYIEVPDYMPLEDEKKFFKNKNVQTSGNLKKKNVVIIILESFGAEYCGYLNPGKRGYTPFLDSLSLHSIVFRNAYSNGKKSIEALPAILSGIPSLMDVPFINSAYQANKVTSIAEQLKRSGWQEAAFFHGATNGSMGFDNYVAASGSGKYFGLNEYPDNKNDHDGNWGIYDGPYLKYFKRHLDKFEEPFCASIFTLSSHHPYKIPGDFKTPIPKGTLPIHKSIFYTDQVLQEFFINASKSTWFKNTLFIIAADHSAENEQEYYRTASGKFRIPILFYDPSLKMQIIKSETFSHVDILPSVLGYLNIPISIKTYGRNAFENNTKGIAIHLENGIYQLVSDSYVLHFDGKNVKGFYQNPPDSLLNNNISAEINATPSYIPESVEIQNQMEYFLKAYLQNYYRSLKTNSLTE